MPELNLEDEENERHDNERWAEEEAHFCKFCGEDIREDFMETLRCDSYGELNEEKYQKHRDAYGSYCVECKDLSEKTIETK